MTTPSHDVLDDVLELARALEPTHAAHLAAIRATGVPMNDGPATVTPSPLAAISALTEQIEAATATVTELEQAAETANNAAAVAVAADATSDATTEATAAANAAFDRRDEAIATLEQLQGQRSVLQRGIAATIPARREAGAGGRRNEPQSIAERLEANAAVQAFREGGLANSEAPFAPIRISGLYTPRETAAVLEGVPGGTTGVGPRIDAQRLETVYVDRRPTRLLDRITVRPVGSPAVFYSVQDPRTNVAAAVPEGQLKPKADLAFTNKTAVVGTIAVTTDVSRQALDDIPTLEGEIETLMRGDLLERTEEYVVAGDGAGTRPRGINNTTGVQTYVPSAAQDRLVTLQEGLDRLEDLFVPQAGTLALNHRDVSKFALKRDDAGGIANTGQYLYANPITGSLPILLGEPLVKTPLLTLGTWILGDFSVVELLVLSGVEVGIFEQNNDNVDRNMVTIRVEFRATVVIKRPGRLVRGTFVDA